MSELYLGTGSTFAPESILKVMTAAASFLESRGYVLRSGGSNGPETAWEAGVKNPKAKEIWLPWKRYNDNKSKLHLVENELDPVTEDPGYEEAESVLKHWDHTTLQARHCYARSIYMLSGAKLDKPVKFVVYWQDESKGEAGCTIALLPLAEKLGIPKFNLWNKETLEKFCKRCGVPVPKV